MIKLKIYFITVPVILLLSFPGPSSGQEVTKKTTVKAPLSTSANTSEQAGKDKKATHYFESMELDRHASLFARIQ